MKQRLPNKYWRSLEERDRPAVLRIEARDEFPEAAAPDAAAPKPGRIPRRDFLRAAGFVFAGAASAGCRAPVEKAIPYLVTPEEITPGRAYHYASTCGACPAACGLLVKNRDGRPVKLEGNPEHPLSRGGLCATGQASILGLYDRRRLRGPLAAGREVSWAELDGEIVPALERMRHQNEAIRLLSGTIHSPSELAAIQAFLSRFPGARHVVCDPLSCSAILDAHETTHGVRLLPRYRFDRARVIAGFDADFLGTWISPVEYTSGYRLARSLENHGAGRAFHAQFESRLSLTGSKADQRFRIAPGETGVILTQLSALLAARAGAPFPAASNGESSLPTDSRVSMDQVTKLADRLWAARERALVVCGDQDAGVQILCNFINHLLASYGSTIDIEAPSRQRQGSDHDLEQLLEEIDDGKVGALLIAGVNQVFELPGGAALAEKIGNIPLTVSFAERADETSDVCRFVCPQPHYLESWGDAEPAAGVVTLRQPCIRPFGDTRSLSESLSAWIGEPKSAYDIVRETWRGRFFGEQPSDEDFEKFWERAVHDGTLAASQPGSPRTPVFRAAEVRPVPSPSPPTAQHYTLVLYPKPGMLDGRHAYNAWLQELPDPVTKITWDNYACISSAAAAELGLEEGDVVRLVSTENDKPSIELPVLIQPGQHDRTVAVALGYGAKASERFAGAGPEWIERRPTLGPNGRVGVNAAPLLAFADGTLRYSGATVSMEPAGRRHPLAATQTYHTITVPEHLAPRGAARRPVIQEMTLDAYREGAHSAETSHHEEHASLWKQDHHYDGRHWAMAIDLDACTGCSACIVGCQVENNIPVVGKDEVRRRREMHWLRIDRYYAGGDDDLEVSHQPMLCQHCENAPCETVCPVLATVHSEEGLNHQIYNRCVGTRYCANNCPYKVRRFNWFDYARDDSLENLVLNPDVTVRSRGVMEKCSFCVQRIQEAKIEAKRRGVPIKDGDVKPACQQSCPADAIVFGDRNDPESRVARLLEDPRRYQVLEELNVRPAVNYLKIVRDKLEKTEGPRHG